MMKHGIEKGATVLVIIDERIRETKKESNIVVSDFHNY